MGNGLSITQTEQVTQTDKIFTLKLVKVLRIVTVDPKVVVLIKLHPSLSAILVVRGTDFIRLVFVANLTGVN